MIYFGMTFLSWIGFFLSMEAGVPSRALYLYVPVALASIAALSLLAHNTQYNRKLMEITCGLTIVVNLGTTASYILAYW
jgi:hypothetical protein